MQKRAASDSSIIVRSFRARQVRSPPAHEATIRRPAVRHDGTEVRLGLEGGKKAVLGDGRGSTDGTDARVAPRGKATVAYDDVHVRKPMPGRLDDGQGPEDRTDRIVRALGDQRYCLQLSVAAFLLKAQSAAKALSPQAPATASV